MFSKELLSHLFDYDPTSGKLIHKKNHGRWNNQGKPAGYPDTNGYIRISICGRRFLLHRLVWTYHHGDIPEGLLIDHINQDCTNNRIENLRLATHTLNLRNRGVGRHNLSTGVRGVSKDPRCNSWSAYVSVSDKSVHLGNFKTKEAAIRARLHGEHKYGYPTTETRLT